jgi:16S rRNA (guanine527-N7)-methyltransferase
VPVSRGREPLPTRVRDTAALGAGYRETLERGLLELRLADLGLEPDADALAIIEGHVRLLLAWTTAINLTAIRDPAVVAIAHVVDSLTAVTLLRERGVERLLDLGSGGGFPGIPLAAAIPSLEVTLLEATAKKARFLETSIGATGLAPRVSVIAERAEELARDPGQRERWPAIAARAVGPLAELVELAFPLSTTGGLLIAWKRGSIDAELAAGERAMRALGGGSIAVRDVLVEGLPGHKLIVVTKSGSAVAADYPRDPAARRRRAW